MCKLPPEHRSSGAATILSRLLTEVSQCIAGTSSVHMTMRLEARRVGSAAGHSGTCAQGRQQQLHKPRRCPWTHQQLQTSSGKGQTLWVKPDSTDPSKPSHAGVTLRGGKHATYDELLVIETQGHAHCIWVLAPLEVDIIGSAQNCCVVRLSKVGTAAGQVQAGPAGAARRFREVSALIPATSLTLGGKPDCKAL